TRTGIDALDEVLWDCFKLAHARETLAEVRWALLLYVAPTKAWRKPARFVGLFGESLNSTRDLIAENEGVWRWLLKTGAKSRPRKLPPYLQTSPLGKVSFTLEDFAYELRLASVRANGEPWFGLDEHGWPLPASD